MEQMYIEVLRAVVRAHLQPTDDGYTLTGSGAIALSELIIAEDFDFIGDLPLPIVLGAIHE